MDEIERKSIFDTVKKSLPWAYDNKYFEILDRDGVIIAQQLPDDFFGQFIVMLANGQSRIAELEDEIAKLRELWETY